MPINREKVTSDKDKARRLEVELMLGEVMLVEQDMIECYLPDDFDRDYALIAAIQHGAPIEFSISEATPLYCNLNKMLLRMRACVQKEAYHVFGTEDNRGLVNGVLNSV